MKNLKVGDTLKVIERIELFGFRETRSWRLFQVVLIK